MTCSALEWPAPPQCHLCRRQAILFHFALFLFFLQLCIGAPPQCHPCRRLAIFTSIRARTSAPSLWVTGHVHGRSCSRLPQLLALAGGDRTWTPPQRTWGPVEQSVGTRTSVCPVIWNSQVCTMASLLQGEWRRWSRKPVLHSRKSLFAYVLLDCLHSYS